MSLAQSAWNLFARVAEKPILAAIPSQPLLRRVAGLHGFLTHRRRRDMRFRPDRLGGVKVWRCDRGEAGQGEAGPGDVGQGLLIHLHGGAYTVGGKASHGHWVADLAHRMGLEGVLVDYRLAPEHPFPAALDDALAVWRAALQATPAARIVLSGDSAGGGLAFALLARLQAEGLAQPAAIVAFSPWTDLTLSGGSITANRRSELMLPMAWIRRAARAYAGGRPAADPGLSPINAVFSKAPPTLILVGAGEILLDDARRMAAVLRGAGTPVTLVEEPGVGHIWPVHAGLSPEADLANARAADFARAALPG